MQTFDSKNLTAQQIAVNLEQERSDLSRNIDGLRERLSVDTLIADAFDYAKANVGPYAKVLDGAVRANPLAAVLTGAGLAWLVLGRGGGNSPQPAPLAGTKVEALSRWEDEGGPVSPLPPSDRAWIAEADSLRSTASDALARIDAAARRRIRLPAQAALDRAKVLADLALATRVAMQRGLDHLTSDARDQIVAAREKTYSARMAAVRNGTRLIEERPLMAGAIGMAIGAAIAVALPKTRTEDRLFGDERDSLVARAQEALQYERSRAAQVATRLADTVADEVNVSARQLLSDAV